MDNEVYADLEFGLHRWSIDSYTAELRFSPPGPNGDVDQRTSVGVRLDLDTLKDLTLSPAEYGRRLTDALFANPDLRQAFVEHRVAADKENAALRLRLFVGPSAPGLHELRWETLRDPQSENDAWLITSERVLFSRYVSSRGLLSRRGGSRAQLRPRANLRTLVVIANPSGLGGAWPELAEIDVPSELERARRGVGGDPPIELATRGEATLANLIEHLGQGFDILYLVCHGRLAADEATLRDEPLVKGEPLLWLEQADGSVAIESGRALIAAMEGLAQLPRMVVLVSCQSAGRATGWADEGTFLHALGPRLAEVGVPAVLAMQGDISMETAAAFLPRFFAEVRRDGQLDRAMAVARRTVANRDDAWKPTLFLRLRTGRLWYTPGERFEKWPALINRIMKGECTPILGPDLHESLLGSRREIAHRWAKEFGYPLAVDDRDDLPQVAQYVAVNQGDRAFLTSALEDYLRQELLDRYRNQLPPALRDAPASAVLDLISVIGAQQRQQDADNPHRVLASLPCDLFITTSQTDLFADALRTNTQPKEPVSDVYRWSDNVEFSSVFDRDPNFQPDIQRPLVYHFFGRIADPSSVVLTEDDYFDFLLGVHRKQSPIPTPVLGAMTRRSLLFLGFRLDDWSFRVLFRTIMSLGGKEKRRELLHVAVQIDPDDDQFVNPQRARRYLEDYFEDEDIGIYWGTADDFTRDLRKELAKRPSASGWVAPS